MGFGRFLVKRIINMVIVLFFTLLITIILVGPTMDNILKLSIEQECRGEANNLKFPTADDRTIWIDTCKTTKIHTVGLDEPWYSPKRLGFALLKIMTLDFGRAYF